MTELSLDPNWPIIAKLKPQLRKHVSIHPQLYRGENWYVLRDQSNGRHLRFNIPTYEFVGRLDGTLTVEEAWSKAMAAAGEEALDQDEVVIVLTQLFTLDVLRSGLPTKAKEFFERHQREKRIRRENSFMNPLSIRFPLIDPNNFLNKFIPWVKPVFSKTGLFLWILIIGFAALLALLNFSALSAEMDTDILSPGNIVSMLLIFIIIKTVHEFGHAFSVKAWGGDVHEMGISLLVLAPVPYVDASAAWAFRDKYKRIVVGAIGIMVELFIASLALFVWLLVEPGIIQNAAFNALLIASVSTLLFNGNPLLRFDGYYVLQDFVEIPNLATRASRYYLYLIKRYVFKLESLSSPATAYGETAWFIGYGFSAFLYRLFILLMIVLLLAQKYLFFGVVIAIWAIIMQIVMPLFRGLKFLAGPSLGENRQRAVYVSAGAIGFISLILLFMPLPHKTSAEGIIWVPDQAQIYAQTEGFVRDVLVPSGTEVKAGTPVIQMKSLPLKTSILKLEARKRELEISSADEFLEDQVEFDVIKEELIKIEAELALLKEQEADLLIKTKVGGTLIISEEWKLKGSYLPQGELIGHIVSPDHLIVRTVVKQSNIGLVREKVKLTEVRIAENPGKVMRVNIDRITPSGSNTLPSRALGAAGGGQIEVSKNDEAGLSTIDKIFHIDLDLPENLIVAGVGERAYVRFNHDAEPLAIQWFRRLRQLFLSRLKF